MMKRLMALMLCLLTVATMFGCANIDKLEGEDDKGAFINMYLGTEIYDFDPQNSVNNDSALKVISLLYEPLFRLDENGKVKKALVEKVEILENDVKSEYKMLLTLANTSWSDATYVSANDVIYAWKRILKPGFSNEACALLYDIKNARGVKEGDLSIDDLGVAAVDELILEITFEGKIDYDQFMLNLTSYALVPLREDIVSRSTDWSKKPATTVASGPYMIRRVVYGEQLILERNANYFRNTDKEDGDVLNKSVNPYRIVINFTDSPEQQMEAFNNDTLFYINEIPLDQRTAYADTATVTDMASTHTYYFNTSNPLFEKAEVRKALSMALDRAAIAEKVVFARPATGIVPYAVFDSTAGSDLFREVGEDLIATSADIEGAKSLLASVGVSGGEFTLTHRADDVDRAIAEMAKAAWEQLGFTVTLRELSSQAPASGVDAVKDDSLSKVFASGDYDVIAIDANALNATAYAVLAPFAKLFSGQGMDMDSGDYLPSPHCTGFDSEAYNAKMEEVYAEKDIVARAALLHEAEKLLLEEMPVIPVVFNQDAYLIHDDLSGLKTFWGAMPDFRMLKLDEYGRFTTAVTEYVAPAQ
ncbi:MAG: peptide ABC transporter substrate-binding protein [Clostridia bacterium]|nr:peptide ABC transporter substrate-binding protein [Clostridia bacterium]